MTEENQTTESQNQAPAEKVEDKTVYDDGVETTEQQDTTAESGQTEEGQQAKEETEKETRPINQEAVDKKINKYVFEKHEEKRKREEAERRLAEREKEIEKLKGASGAEIPVPEMPEPYDYDYKERIKQREEIVLKNAEIRARQKMEQERRAAENIQRENEVKEATQKQVASMYQKASEFGIDNEEFSQADRRVAMFIQDPNVARFILASENSPLIVQYLSQNVLELENISKMDTVNAAIHLLNVVTPNALKLKPSTTKTPDPLDIPSGKGVQEKKSRFLDGVTFE